MWLTPPTTCTPIFIFTCIFSSIFIISNISKSHFQEKSGSGEDEIWEDCRRLEVQDKGKSKDEEEILIIIIIIIIVIIVIIV
ncbi:hypothetical protein HID58_072646 [Brassica napus]|uniref:Transmembrane protein n=1 Tax=Brassica napus TaxID=3708 RepID=A0ABQ7Z505_BRANA|nr:hypothetical protein HID58_072646 [Brassica napus]